MKDTQKTRKVAGFIFVLFLRRRATVRRALLFYVIIFLCRINRCLYSGITLSQNKNELIEIQRRRATKKRNFAGKKAK
jgi:hypothetical protein